MSQSFIIGLSGSAGSGKDTVAGILLGLLGPDACISALADPIRAAAAHLLGADALKRPGKDSVQIFRFDERSSGVTFADRVIDACALIDAAAAEVIAVALMRALDAEGALRLQKYGVSLKTSPRRVMQLLGTECGRNLLGEDFWIKRLRDNVNAPAIELVPDVRFQNEAEFCDYRIGVYGRGLPLSDHPSDRETRALVATADVSIDNGGRVETLEYLLQHYVLPVILRAYHKHQETHGDDA